MSSPGLPLRWWSEGAYEPFFATFGAGWDDAMSPAGAPIRRQGQADDTGRQHRGGKHGDLLGGEIGGHRERLARAMNSDIVKTMPAKAPAPASWRQKYSSRLTAKPSRTTSAGNRHQSERLADHQRGHDRQHQGFVAAGTSVNRYRSADAAGCTGDRS